MTITQENAVQVAKDAMALTLEWERKYRELQRDYTALKEIHRKCLRMLAEGA